MKGPSMFNSRAALYSLAVKRNWLFYSCILVFLFTCSAFHASAQTLYNTSSVTCASGGDFQTQSPDPSGVLSEVDLYVNTTEVEPFEAQCTWSGFPSVLSTAGMRLYISGYLAIYPTGPNRPKCSGGGSGSVMTTVGTWSSSCDGNYSTSFPITPGTDISTITIKGTAATVSSTMNSTDLDITAYIQ
jgi:hypothetical protein